MLPQALFMFCWAAECPPFGAILPRLFISDSISSALLLLKGGEALLCQQRVLCDLLELVAGLGLLSSPIGCGGWLCHCVNSIVQAHGAFVSVLIFHGPPLSKHTYKRAGTAKHVPDTTTNYQHAHTCRNTRACLMKGVGQDLCRGVYKV